MDLCMWWRHVIACGGGDLKSQQQSFATTVSCSTLQDGAHTRNTQWSFKVTWLAVWAILILRPCAMPGARRSVSGQLCVVARFVLSWWGSSKTHEPCVCMSFLKLCWHVLAFWIVLFEFWHLSCCEIQFHELKHDCIVVKQVSTTTTMTTTTMTTTEFDWVRGGCCCPSCCDFVG